TPDAGRIAERGPSRPALGAHQHQGIPSEPLTESQIPLSPKWWTPMNSSSPRLSRRQMLKVGVLGAGFSLSDCLRLQAAANSRDAQRSAILVFLWGGPSHQDTFDLKPHAPAEYRGVFRPIATASAGVQICEHLPQLARRSRKYAVIRGITHNLAEHLL